jgi:hypothetical protein
MSIFLVLVILLYWKANLGYYSFIFNIFSNYIPPPKKKKTNKHTHTKINQAGEIILITFPYMSKGDRWGSSEAI